MTISLLVAVSQNGVIGQGDKLPWHIPSELKHFAKQTAGKTMLVGRKTWASMAHIDLKDRKVIVVTSDAPLCSGDPKLISARNAGKVFFIDSPEQAIEIYRASRNPLVIVGGKSIYERCAKYCERFVVTTIHRDYEGDVTLDVFDGLNGIRRNRWYGEAIKEDAELGTPAYTVKHYVNHTPEWPEPKYITIQEYKELIKNTDGYEEGYDLSPLYSSRIATKILNEYTVVMDPEKDLTYQQRIIKLMNGICASFKPILRDSIKNLISNNVFIRPTLRTSSGPSSLVLAHVETIARKRARTAFDSVRVPVLEEDKNVAYLVFPKPITSFSEDKLDEVTSRTWRKEKLVILGLDRSPDSQRLKSFISKGLKKRYEHREVEIEFRG